MFLKFITTSKIIKLHIKLAIRVLPEFLDVLYNNYKTSTIKKGSYQFCFEDERRNGEIMQVTVKSNKPILKIENFAAHGHIHPTERLNDMSGQENLRRMARDGCLEYVRLYTMHEHIVSMDKDGNLKYNWTENDERLDLLVECNIKPILCFGFMPECIAEGYEDRKRHRRGRQLYPFAPSDYSLWREVCRAYTEHVLERYGLETIKNWYFECWNEPDGGFFIPEALGNKDQEVHDQKYLKYEKMYDAFAMGVKDVSKELLVGGPGTNSMSSNVVNYAERLVDHAVNGINHETGEKDVPFDFLSYHAYAGGKKAAENGIAPKLEGIMYKLNRGGEILNKYGISVPLLLNEWDILGMSGCLFAVQKNPDAIRYTTKLDMRYHDTEYMSAMFAKMMDMVIRGPLMSGVPLKMMALCMVDPEIQSEGEQEFIDARTIITPGGFIKPIYHLHSIASKLKGQLLEMDADMSEYAGVVPIKSDDECIRTMVYYIKEDFFEKIPNDRMKLKIEGVKGKFRVRHYRIDHMMSNSFTKWAELGMPAAPNIVEREHINRAGKLTLLYPETEVMLDGTFEEEIYLSQNCVSYIELSPVK